jgi:hypothetical protein
MFCLFSAAFILTQARPIILKRFYFLTPNASAYSQVTSIGEEGKENEKSNEVEPAEKAPDGSLRGLRQIILIIQKEAKLVQLEKNQRDPIDMARTKHRLQARALLERAGKAADNRDKVEAGHLTADAYAYAEESKRHVGKAKEAEAKRFDLEKRGIHDFQVSNRGWLENPAKLSKTRCGLALSSSVSSSEDDSSFRKWVKREDTKHRLKHVSLWPCSFNFDEACEGDEPSLYMKTREILNILSAEERVQPMGSWTSTPQDNGTMASSICSSVNDATYAQNTTGGQKEEPTTLLHLLDLNDKLACGIIQSFGNVQREEKTYESARFVKQWNNKNNFEQGSQSSFQDSHAESRGEITMDDERNTLLDIRALPESNDILDDDDDDDDDDATECIVANPDWTMTCAPRLKSPVFLSSESQETATSTFDPYYNTCGATATTPEKRDEERDESTEVIPQQDGSMAFVSHQDTRSLAFLGPQPRPKPKIALRLYKYCQKGKQLFSCDAPTVVSTRYSERLFLQESDISDNSMVAEWNYKR